MAQSGQWITRGFESFRRGTFGNAGQNLYVSRRGILQRIHLHDLNRDGYIDAVFCNCQDQWEMPDVYVYTDPMNSQRRIALPSDGSVTGDVADFNGDGYDDLVLGMEYNGATTELHAFIYYGSSDGLAERYCLRLPAPHCQAVAAGDFDGDGRPDLAFITKGKLRMFYQTELGFEPQGFQDLDVSASHLAAADLDGDGFADLYVLVASGAPRVYWGGPDGIDPTRYSDVVIPKDADSETFAQEADEAQEQTLLGLTPLAKTVHLRGCHHVLVAMAEHAYLVPLTPQRGFGEPIKFACPSVMSVAAGDINGNGEVDLVFAARDEGQGQECSWIYWADSRSGYSEDRRTPLATYQACDVAVAPLDENGLADVVICQNQTPQTYSVNSLVFRGSRDGVFEDPIPLPTEGARRVFIAKTSDSSQPQVIFVNRWGRTGRNIVDPVVYFGGPDGFHPDRHQKLSGIGATSAAGCDLTDNGVPDLVIANSAENASYLDPGSYCFFQDSDGFSYDPSLILPTKHAWGLAVADLDRDGFLEVVIVPYRGPDVWIFSTTADGIDVDHPQRVRLEADGKCYEQPFRCCLADLNNNGWLDLVLGQLGSDRCFILWGGPDGFDFNRRQTLSVVRGISADAADLTGNGYLDLIIGGHLPQPHGPHDSFVYVYWNGPEGLSEARRMQLPANTVNTLGVADFNKDGRLDLFVGCYHDGRARDIDSFIYWGGKGGAFSARQVSRIQAHSVTGCLIADFNEDGYPDLMLCNHKTLGDHEGDAFVLMNGPDGFGGRPVTRLPTMGAHGMIVNQPGNQRDRGSEEYYISEPFELPPSTQICNLHWQAEVPTKTWVQAQLRSSASHTGLESASWRGPNGEGSWFQSGDAPEGFGTGERWVQYRLALGAVNGGQTPRVTEVTVEYE